MYIYIYIYIIFYFKKHTLARIQRRSLAQISARVENEAKSFGMLLINPTFQDRLRSNVKLALKISAVLTGHGLTKA